MISLGCLDPIQIKLGNLLAQFLRSLLLAHESWSEFKLLTSLKTSFFIQICLVLWSLLVAWDATSFGNFLSQHICSLLLQTLASIKPLCTLLLVLCKKVTHNITQKRIHECRKMRHSIRNHLGVFVFLRIKESGINKFDKCEKENKKSQISFLSKIINQKEIIPSK